MAYKLAKEMKEFIGKDLSPSTVTILNYLIKKGEVSAKEIKTQLNFSTRTVQYSLAKLVDKKIVERRPYLHDMRQSRYSLNSELMEKAKMQAYQAGLRPI